MTPGSFVSFAGFQRQAEWAEHQATWLAWPHRQADWPGKMIPAQWAFVEMLRHLVGSERVKLICASEQVQLQAQKMLQKSAVDLTKIDCLIWPLNRSWTRDFGPIFLKHAASGEVAIANFKFTSWAKYRLWAQDDQVASLAAQELCLPLLEPTTKALQRFVLEGGAIDVNGQGTVLTTEECLLDQKTQVRNAGLTKQENEDYLKQFLGVDQVIWLNKGVRGDDTHGHVDDICRFVRSDTVVLALAEAKDQDNYHALQENRERLQNIRLQNGKKLQVIKLPLPAPLFFHGLRLPASYANFFIANEKVLVPTFNDPQDRLALGILQELLPERTVVGINCVDLIWGFGAIHCLTSEQPH